MAILSNLTFLQSLAIVLAVAAVIIVLFQRFRQPVILGYILAGFPIALLVTDEASTSVINTIANLGIILLLFSIGLEFNLRRLRQIGFAVIAAGTLEVILMIALGYQIGILLGWRHMDAVFLGLVLSIASTMITVKTLKDAKRLDESVATTILGVLIVEDLAVILILSSASGLLGVGASLTTEGLLLFLLRLIIFVPLAIAVGLFVIPWAVNRIGKMQSGEVLVISVLGLGFAMAVIAEQLGFSAAIGAFLMGVLISESAYSHEIIRRVEPIRDLFAALFFVTIGTLAGVTLGTEIFEGRTLAAGLELLIWTVLVPAVVVTLLFFLAKGFVASLSVFLCGFGASTAFTVGISLLSLGEFSILLAKLGTETNIGTSEIPVYAVTQTFFPIIVIAVLLTALSLPYFVRAERGIASGLRRVTPRPLTLMVTYLDLLVTTLRRRSSMSGRLSSEMRRLTWRLFLNILAIVAVFFVTWSILPSLEELAGSFGENAQLFALAVVFTVLAFILPAMFNIWRETIRFIEIATSEAMLSTQSAEYIGYQITSRLVSQIILAIYLLVTVVIISPILFDLSALDIRFALIAVALAGGAIYLLRDSIQILNVRVGEAIHHRVLAEERRRASADLEQIMEIIKGMEEGKG